MKAVAAFCVSLASVALASIALAADELPKSQAFARYEPMMNTLPFAAATRVAVPTQALVADLYIDHIARLPDGDVVTLTSKADKNLKIQIRTKAPKK